MKTLYLLFSHTLTQAQEYDARTSFHIGAIRPLPDKLQALWSNVPPELSSDEMKSHLYEIYLYIKTNILPGDVVLVQGDFGATCWMAAYVRSLGGIPVYATTRRRAEERKEGDKVLKTSVFEHVRFREYPNLEEE